MMLHLRALILAAVVAALAVSVVGALSLAGTPRNEFSIVNGWPGKRVDVCINGREVRTGLPYGGKTIKPVSKGRKQTVKFFENSPARCGGGLLGKKVIPADTIYGHHDLIVLTRQAPQKVYSFDNDFSVPPDAVGVVTHHAADIGKLTVYWHDVESGAIEPQPAATADAWVKGNVGGVLVAAGSEYRQSVRRYVNDRLVTKGKVVVTDAGRLYTGVIVGTSRKNARLVEFSRPHPYFTPTPPP